MQNSTSNSSLPSSTTSASINSAAFRADLARAYKRARERMRVGSLADLLLSTDTGHADEVPDEESAPCGPAAPDAVAAPDRRQRVTLDELLPVFREPIEWAFARAEHQAQGDPDDLAVLARVRKSYQARLLWLSIGGSLSDFDIRPTDLLLAASLLAVSIDPTLVELLTAGWRGGSHDSLAR